MLYLSILVYLGRLDLCLAGDCPLVDTGCLN